MPVVWTMDGDENSWVEWSTAMAESAVSPLAEELLANKHGIQKKIALDIGCGTGRAFLPLTKAGFEVIGFDPVMAGLRASRKRCEKDHLSASIVCASANWIPFPSSSIDFVLAIGVLFHLSPPELDLSLQSIRRVMKPDGEAILHFLDLHDWRKSLANIVRPEHILVPSCKAVVTSFCSEDVVRDRLALNSLNIKSMGLRSKETERGMQLDWIACCVRK